MTTFNLFFFLSCQTRNCTVFKFIFQLCIYARNFFSKLQNCKDHSCLKKWSKREMNNYRPISISTCFSKIIEKILFVRLTVNLFKKHNVIYENQYGFQSNISTSHAMLDVVTSSYNNIHGHSYTGLALSI